MQKLGRFWETKFIKVIFSWLFGMFLSASTGGCVTELTAAEKWTVLCEGCLEFARDVAVGHFTHYPLLFQ